MNNKPLFKNLNELKDNGMTFLEPYIINLFSNLNLLSVPHYLIQNEYQSYIKDLIKIIIKSDIHLFESINSLYNLIYNYIENLITNNLQFEMNLNLKNELSIQINKLVSYLIN